MDLGTTTDPGERLSDAIELVSHETRARTLVALAAAQAATPDDPVLAFSELRRRVDHDDPGNFNYHLDRLRGRLVERADGGYRLSGVGHNLVGVLLSGRFDPAASVDLGDATAACLLCGDRAPVAYEDAALRVDCPAGHETRLVADPAAVARRDVDVALDAALRRSLVEATLAARGECPFCGGPTGGGLTRPSGSEPAAPTVFYGATCDRCGVTLQTTVGGHVLFHPAVVGVCWRAGLDVRDDPWRALADHVGAAAVAGETPLRAAVTVTGDGERVRLTVAADGSVTDSTTE